MPKRCLASLQAAIAAPALIVNGAWCVVWMNAIWPGSLVHQASEYNPVCCHATSGKASLMPDRHPF